uniref:Alpha-carbonic anhydrase domain-containing protein n=1 Tax=Solanum lycopersicum TaxID=4081 RepID=A0A3Q7IKG2_SOLLC
MEAHMVHQSDDGRLAVVAIPFKIGAGHVKRVDDKGLKLGLVNPQQLGVKAEPFYRYIGSLTVPPCTEGIIWSARTVSMEQMMALRNFFLQGFEANARPVQGLHRRPVYLAM